MSLNWCLYVSLNEVIIGSGNGWSHGRCQAITWNSIHILSVRPFGWDLKILIEIQTFPFYEMHLKMFISKIIVPLNLWSYPLVSSQAVPVASPNRHLIYTGELMWIVDGTRWERVHVLLFNDLLLIVQLASKNYFNVIHDPIPLTEVLSADFSNKHRKYLFLSTISYSSSLS